jgi:hypothetical protein
VTAPVQLILFGPVAVHIATVSPVTCSPVCALCKVSLAVAGVWDRLDGCHNCPGWIEPAPLRTLGGAETADGHLPSLAADLEERAA